MRDLIRGIEWGHPEWILAIVPVLLLWSGLGVFAWYRNQAARRRFADSGMFPHLIDRSTKKGSWWVWLLQATGLTGVLLALAAPKYGEIEQPVIASGQDIYVLLDVSRSMLAGDVSPSRLDRAKADIASLTSRLHGERIGLIVFAGQAVIQCPLTVDYENFRKAVGNVDILSSPRGGTAIGRAVRKALEMFSPTENNKHSILLITDGGDQQSDPMGAAREAASAGVPLYIIGLGDTSTGARVPVAPSRNSYVEFEGEQVWSKLDKPLLTSMATTTNGAYIDVGTKALSIDSLYEQYLKRMDVGDSQNADSIVTKVERFQWPLCIGLIGLLASQCLQSFRGGFRSLQKATDLLSLPATQSIAGIALVLCFGASDGSGSQVSDFNASGLKHFDAGDFAAADEAFLKAKSLLQSKDDPNRACIDFNLGCVAQASGDWDKAFHQYELASRSSELGIIEAAQYQLGNALVAKLVASQPDENSDRLQLAARAIEAYGNALSIDPSNGKARTHLESLKIWLAEQKKAEELATLQAEVAPWKFLEHLDKLIERQSKIEQSIKQIKSNRQVREQHQLLLDQRKLAAELPLLLPKFAAESKNDSSDSEAGQVAEKLTEKLSGIAQTMHSTGVHLLNFDARDAAPVAAEATQQLEDLWNSLASYEVLLDKAFQVQTTLVEALAKKSESAGEWSQNQFRNRNRTATLEQKANFILEALEETSEESPTLAAMKTAKELLPKAVESMEQASEAFSQKQTTSTIDQATELATEQAAEAHRILEELLKSLPPPENDQQQNDQQENNEEKSNEEDEQQSPDKQDSSSTDQPNSENQQSDQQKSSEQKSDENQSGEDQQDDSQNEGSKEGKSEESDGNKPAQENATDQETAEESADESKAEDSNVEDSKTKESESESEAPKATGENESKEKAADKQSSQSPEEQKTEEQKTDGETLSEGAGKPLDEVLVSQERMDQIMRKVREREAAKRIRDRRVQELLRGRQRVEKDW